MITRGDEVHEQSAKMARLRATPASVVDAVSVSGGTLLGRHALILQNPPRRSADAVLGLAPARSAAGGKPM
jgi:hypothetical protein